MDINYKYLSGLLSFFLVLSLIYNLLPNNCPECQDKECPDLSCDCPDLNCGECPDLDCDCDCPTCEEMKEEELEKRKKELERDEEEVDCDPDNMICPKEEGVDYCRLFVKYGTDGQNGFHKTLRPGQSYVFKQAVGCELIKVGI